MEVQGGIAEEEEREGKRGDKPRTSVEHLIIRQSTTCVSLPTKEHIITCPAKVEVLVS